MEAAPEMGHGDGITEHKGGRPPGTTNAETAARRRKVARLLATQGAMSATEISDRLGISLSTATRDLAAIKEEWRAEMLEATDAVIARDLAELGIVKQEAWRVYAKSLEQGDETVTEQEIGEGKVLVTRVTSNAKPNLAALKMVQDCIEKKRKILGLDKEEQSKGPKVVVFTVKVGDRVLVSEASTGEAVDVPDAEFTELDSTGKALPRGGDDE